MRENVGSSKRDFIKLNWQCIRRLAVQKVLVMQELHRAGMHGLNEELGGIEVEKANCTYPMSSSAYPYITPDRIAV